MKIIRDHLNDKYNKTGRYYNEKPFKTRREDPEANKAYNEREAEIVKTFQEDLEKEFGVDKYSKPVRDKIFSKAWADGHAYGLSEIHIHYWDIVDFVEELVSLGV